eukprot:2618168-Rhodomonas_salina.3
MRMAPQQREFWTWGCACLVNWIEARRLSGVPHLDGVGGNAQGHVEGSVGDALIGVRLLDGGGIVVIAQPDHVEVRHVAIAPFYAHRLQTSIMLQLESRNSWNDSGWLNSGETTGTTPHILLSCDLCK